MTENYINGLPARGIFSLELDLFGNKNQEFYDDFKMLTVPSDKLLSKS